MKNVTKSYLKDPSTYVLALGAAVLGKSGYKTAKKFIPGLKSAVAEFPIGFLDTDKTAGFLSAAAKYGKSVAGWAGFGAATSTFGDEEGRKRDGVFNTFAKHIQNPKLWLASAAVIPAMGGYNKLHKKVLGHYATKGGKVGKVASFLKDNKVGKVIDPTGASFTAALGYGALGITTPYNAIMGISDVDSKVWSGLKGKFWEPNKKYKTPVEEDSF